MNRFLQGFALHFFLLDGICKFFSGNRNNYQRPLVGQSKFYYNRKVNKTETENSVEIGCLNSLYGGHNVKMKNQFANRIFRIVLPFVLLLLMLSMLTGCFGSKITVDENGVASWKSVKRASKYEYCFVDANYSTEEYLYTEDTSVQLPEGFCVHVTPIMENGDRGTTMFSDFFGEPTVIINPDEWVADEWVADEWVDNSVLIDPNFTLEWDDVSTWEVISNIRMDTLEMQEDGTVTFTANGPDGKSIRFSGTGIAVEEGSITFEPGGMLTSLDSIGRICYVGHTVLEDSDPDVNFIECSGGYTLTDATSVESADELYFCRGSGIHASYWSGQDKEFPMSTMWTQPNMLHWGAYYRNTGSFSISALTVGYDTLTYCTPVKEVYLTPQNNNLYYVEGQKYNESWEVHDFETERCYFDMVIRPDVLDLAPETDVEAYLSGGKYALSAIDDMETDSGKFTIGNLLDADGNPVDKSSTIVTADSRLEVDIAGTTYLLGLPFAEQVAGDVKTLSELDSIVIPPAEGEINALVIPIMWQDQPENATDKELDYFRSQLGRVADISSTAKEYSEDELAFSRYFETASYGKLSITSYMTDWYPAQYDFSTMKEVYIGSAENTLVSEVEEWLYTTYPDTDWSQFDNNGDGNFDVVILLNAGRDYDDDYFMAATYEGGVYWSGTADAESAGTPEKPTINGYTSVNIGLMEDSGNVLVHEVGHNFGLIDYYDVTYAGINVIGTYDMQSDNAGDWNAFSKYCVGWLEPTVVEDLESGEYVDITIGSMTTTGDAIVIPAAGTEHNGPFNEYMLVDLFTDDGLYESSAGDYGLSDTAGVRIYHIDARMTDISKMRNTMKMSDESFISQVYTNAYNTSGLYQLELLQNGGKNTFTSKNGRTTVSAEDLFYAGDVFDAADYDEFLIDGLMDNSMEFGYIIEVVSIDTDAAGETTATVRITRQ